MDRPFETCPARVIQITLRSCDMAVFAGRKPVTKTP